MAFAQQSNHRFLAQTCSPTMNCAFVASRQGTFCPWRPLRSRRWTLHILPAGLSTLSPMSERRPAGRTIIRMAWSCLLASVVVAALLFPVVGGVALMSNRASDIVANGSAQLLDGEIPR